MAYGIDWEGPIPEEIETLEEVHVPDITCPLQSSADLAELSAIDPLRESDNYGIEIFLETKHFVYSKIQQFQQQVRYVSPLTMNRNLDLYFDLHTIVQNRRNSNSNFNNKILKVKCFFTTVLYIKIHIQEVESSMLKQ